MTNLGVARVPNTIRVCVFTMILRMRFVRWRLESEVDFAVAKQYQETCQEEDRLVDYKMFLQRPAGGYKNASEEGLE